MEAPKRIALAAALACAGATGAAGCGSSGSGSGTGSTAASAPSQTPTSSLKVSTTPRYAAPPASGPASTGTVAVAYRNITIQPDVLRVRAGTTVRWTNFDPVEHNVTSRGGPQPFASGPMAEGATFSVKLTRPGVIHYLCTIHPTSMNGTIEVVR
jgi:plastocyanin